MIEGIRYLLKNVYVRSTSGKDDWKVNTSDVGTNMLFTLKRILFVKGTNKLIKLDVWSYTLFTSKRIPYVKWG